MKDVYELITGEVEKPLVYLCSRIKPSAIISNDNVAEALRRAGFEVFVPHEAAHNIDDKGDDKLIFRTDYEQLTKAAIIVIVPNIGVDCAWEIGWAAANCIPTYVYSDTDVTICEHPMIKSNIEAVYTSSGAIYGVLKQDRIFKNKTYYVEDVEDFGEYLYREHGPEGED